MRKCIGGLLLFILMYFESLFAESTQEESQSSFSTLGSVGGGLSYTFSCFPHCGDLYGTAHLQFLLQCKKLGLCTQYSIGLFRSDLSLSFSSDPRGQADPSNTGSLPDYHIPYGSFNLRTIDFQFTPRLYASFGNFSLSRAHYYLNEALNLQGTLGMVSTRFGKLQKRYAKGGCSLGLAGPGFKTIRYSSGAIPFDGIYALGMQQDCQLVVGNSHIQTMLSYSLQSTLSIGQSGAGTERTPGPFGGLVSENHFTLGAQLFLKAPSFLEHKGIVGFSLDAPFTIYYHMNRGCIRDTDITNPSCSNNSSGLEVRVPILFNILWGESKKTNSSSGLSSEWLSPSRFTQSQGL